MCPLGVHALLNREPLPSLPLPPCLLSPACLPPHTAPALPTCAAARQRVEQLAVAPGQQRAYAGVHGVHIHILCKVRKARSLVSWRR